MSRRNSSAEWPRKKEAVEKRGFPLRELEVLQSFL